MSQQKIDINSLRIASPCPITWNDMSGDDRTRHCSLCELNVHNVSGMTRDEVERMIAEREGRLCVRFFRRADGTVITKDCPVGLRTYRKRAVRVASTALATVLGFFSIAYGQKDDGAKTIKASEVKIVTLVDYSKKSELQGTVMDVNGAVVPNAKVLLYQSDDKVSTTSSDAEGVFQFGELAAGTYRIELRSNIGFQTLIVKDLELGNGEQKDLALYLDVAPGIEVVGEFIKTDPGFVIPDPQIVPTVIPINPRPAKKPD